MKIIDRPTSLKNGVWQKLLDVLYNNLGKIVTNEELIKVSGQHNYARRIRELRAEAGVTRAKNLFLHTLKRSKAK